MYYLNPPLPIFAHKTCILNEFEAETSIYFFVKKIIKRIADRQTHHVKPWVGNAKQTYS